MSSIPTVQFKNAYDRLIYGDKNRVDFGRNNAWCMDLSEGSGMVALYHYDTLIAQMYPEKEEGYNVHLYWGYSASDRDGINSLSTLMFGHSVARISGGELVPADDIAQFASRIHP